MSGPFDPESSLLEGKKIFKQKTGMAAKKGVRFGRMIRDFTKSGFNEAFTDEQKSTNLMTIHDLVRLALGAKSMFLADWKHAYRQVYIAKEDRRFHAYCDFGMLFIDLRLPFGRADSARVFQLIANTLVKAIRKNYKGLFTMSRQEAASAKKVQKTVSGR